jgi:hypothetical protein
MSTLRLALDPTFERGCSLWHRYVETIGKGLPGPKVELPAKQARDYERYLNDQGPDTSLSTAKVSLVLNGHHVFRLRPGDEP